MNKIILALTVVSSLVTQTAFACDPATIKSKIGLFTGPSCLRGANVFQQQQYAEPGQVWSPVLDTRDLADMKAAGANMVNLSIPGPYNVKSPYARNSGFMARMDALVNYAAANDLFVVLSFRTGPGRGEGQITGDGYSNKELYTNTTAQTAFINMWKEVATRYKAKKNIVGYEILVEPNGVTKANWRALAQKVVNAIRTVDTKTPILVAPHAWGVVSSLSTFAPLSGTNLVYTVHQYEPYYYTHENQGADWNASLTASYAAIQKWRTTYGKPVVVNEYGVENFVGDGHHFLEKQFSFLESAGLSHAAWIWEVEYDPSYTYEGMDFKEQPALLSTITPQWRKNLSRPSLVTFTQ